MFSEFLVLLWPLAICLSIGFAFLWTILKGSGKYEVVDAFWCWTLGASAIYVALVSDGLELRRLLLASFSTFWSIRLGGFLFWGRVKKGLSDGRYEFWVKEMGASINWKMFIFFQIQALSVIVLSVTFLAVCKTSHDLSFFDLLAAILFVVAILGEWKADKTLNQFRLNPNNKGLVCDKGLWAYSRHPNYFFEWLHWCSYAVICAPHLPLLLISLSGPIFILILVTKVSGIPLTEAQTLRSRGDAFKKYQLSTSAFFPIFFKKGNLS